MKINFKKGPVFAAKLKRPHKPENHADLRPACSRTEQVERLEGGKLGEGGALLAKLLELLEISTFLLQDSYRGGAKEWNKYSGAHVTLKSVLKETHLFLLSSFKLSSDHRIIVKPRQIMHLLIIWIRLSIKIVCKEKTASLTIGFIVMNVSFQMSFRETFVFNPFKMLIIEHT